MTMVQTTEVEVTNEALTVGASSHEQQGWHQINWYQAEQNVHRLQVRIVKATKEGRWGNVKASQRLPTYSQSGKALAVKQVTENQGKKTPGVDKITWDTPQQKAQAIHELEQRGYRSQPLKRVSIPKSSGKQYSLGIPTMQDRAMQALYLLALNPIAETTVDPHSYEFRPERCTADALVYCHTLFSMKTGATWVLEADIKSCFDRISHEWLLTHIPLGKGILRKWLKAGYMEKSLFYPTEEGTPQGSIISPALANMALDDLGKVLREAHPGTHQGDSPKVNLARYADDFIITGATKHLLEEEVKPLVETFMREYGLELSPEKTVITHSEECFDLLGQQVQTYKHGVVRTTPSKKNVHTFLEKVRKTIEDNKDNSAGRLIVQLHPMIQGWAIYKKLWQWARWGHPHKSATWVKRKYFTTVETRNWVFTGEIFEKDGDAQRVHLRKAMDVSIQRHTFIRGEANPCDPTWEHYFEKRLDVKMERNLMGKKQLLHLWREQHGLCPLCHQKITTITGWHSHPVIWRRKGGTDKPDNRMLFHPNCHRQLHSQHLTVMKLRPVTCTVLKRLGCSNAPRLPSELDQTLDLPFVLTATRRVLATAVPVIWNSDQGSYFTSPHYLQLLRDSRIQISIDSKGRALDTIFTERLGRMVKYEEVYLHDYTSPKETHHQLSNYFEFYNHHRSHQAFDCQTPAEVCSTGKALFPYNRRNTAEGKGGA